LEKACIDLKTLTEENKQSPLFISVNISARQLAKAEHIAKFISIVEKAGVDPGCIILEVTETMMISEQDYARQTLSSLQDHGFVISLDDFGTGFSSLSHLQKFPVNMIKIDRTFIKQMLHDYDSMQIVKASIGLARALDLETVAEGVESEEELARLAELNCDYAQGYYFTKPLPLAEAIEFLKKQ
jgi:EAL domain-containing protein (putative c-di-GMP-specific phosphodiesterase class I)